MSLMTKPLFSGAKRTNEISKNSTFNQTSPQRLYNFGYGKAFYREDEAEFQIRLSVGPIERSIGSFLAENSRAQQDGGKGNQYAVGYVPHEIYRRRRYYSREALDRLITYLTSDQCIKGSLREASGSDKALAECMVQHSATSEYDARMDADFLADMEAELLDR